MLTLTRRQREILEFIEQFIDSEGMPPTRLDICRGLGFRSPNAAQDHLRALERKGAIEMLSGTSRGIRVRGGPSDGLPLVGRVAAGMPILAAEHVEGRYRIDPTLFSPRADYLLRVRGASMRDAGIHDGDLLAVHRTPVARNGEIVVARIGDEVTVKRLRQRGRMVTLIAENAEFAPITVDPVRETFAIEGVGVGVIRNQTL